MISSQARYDHFDTPPCITIQFSQAYHMISNQGIPLPTQHLRKNRIDALPRRYHNSIPYFWYLVNIAGRMEMRYNENN